MLWLRYLLFLGVFLSLAMAVTIYTRNRKSEANVLFTFLSLLIALCFYVDYRLTLAGSEEEYTALLRIVALRTLVFPVSAHFFLVLSERKKFLKSPLTYILLYVFPVIMITSTGPEDILQITLIENVGYSFAPKNTLLGIINSLWILGLVIAVNWLAIKHFIKSRSRLRRNQARLLMVGFLISLFLPIVSDIVLPMAGAEFPDFGSIYFIAGMLLVGYAILKYDLFAATPESAAEEVIEAVLDAVILTHPFGSISFCNPAVEKLTGFKKDDLVDRHINEIFRIPVIDDLTNNELENITNDLVTAEGSPVHVMVSHTVLHHSGTTVNGHVFILHQITELKNLMDKLSESEIRYKNIFNNIQSVYFELLPDLSIAEISPSVSMLTAYHRDDIIGLHISRLFPGQHSLANFTDLIKNDQQAVNFEAELVDRDCSNQYCMINAMCIYKDHVPQKIVGSVTNIDDLKKAELRILESEKRYRLVTENSTDFVSQIDQQGLFVYISPSFRAYGYTTDQFIGKSPAFLIHSEDLPLWKQQWEESAATGIFKSLEFRIRHADGRYIWAEIQGKWIRDEEKRYLICSTRDISERKTLEAQQKASEEKFRLLFEKSPDGILLVRDLFTPISANASLLKIFGFESHGEFIGKPLISHILPEDQIKMVERFRLKSAGISTGSQGQIRICRKDGQYRNVEYLEHELFIHGEQYIQFIMRDVTEKLLADQKLVESEQRYSLLVENSPDDIFLFDEHYRFVMVNAQAALNMGHPADQLVGKTMHDIFPRHIADRQKASVQKVFNSGQMSEHIKTMTRTLHGDRWYTTVLVPVKNARGKVVSVIGIGRDVTDMEKAEIKIRKNEEMYRLFLENFQGIALRVNMDNRFEFLYGQVHEITGYSIEDFYAGLPDLNAMLHPEDRYQVIRAIAMLRKIPNSKITSECRIVNRNGKVHYLRIFLQNILNEEGKPAYIQAALFDKTDIYELQNKIINTIIETEERERARFAEDLHDDLGPLLSSIRIYINLIQTKAPEQEKERKELIDFAKQLLDDAVQQTRSISYNIMPEILSQYGLIPSVKSFCSKIDRTFKVRVTIKTEGFPDDVRFDSKTEVALYRALKELINNTLKHSGAEDITIRFYRSADKNMIEYMDNGQGFNYDEKFRAGTTLGLRNIFHRVESINGTVHFTTDTGQGLKVVFSW